MENQSRLLPFPTLPNFRGGSLRPGAEPFTPTFSFKHGGQQRASSSMGAPFAGPRPPSHSLREASLLNGHFHRPGLTPSQTNNGNSYNKNDNSYNNDGNNLQNHNKSALHKSLSTPVSGGNYQISKAQIQDLNTMTNMTNFNHNLRYNQSENQSNDHQLFSPDQSRIPTGSGARSEPFSPPQPSFSTRHHFQNPATAVSKPDSSSASSSSSPSDSSSAAAKATTQIEDLVHLLTRYFDAVKLCYATNISVAQTFSALLGGGDDGASTNAQVAGRFLAFSRESGTRIIDDAQRHKEATATQLVQLVAHLTDAATAAAQEEAREGKEEGNSFEERSDPSQGDLHRKVVCQSFCSLMHFHNKLANLANVANFDDGSFKPFIDGHNAQNTKDSSHSIFSTAGPLKVTTSPQKPFQIRSDGDALDLVMEMLSAGLTSNPGNSATGVPSNIPPPLPTQPPPPLPPNQSDDLRSNQPSRFHTLPHLTSATNASLNHQISSRNPSSLHSSLPRNFMPQFTPNHAQSPSNQTPPSHSGVPAVNATQDRTPAISFLDRDSFSSQRSDNANSIVNGITSNVLDGNCRIDSEAPLFPPRPPPTRGGTWPNSILRGAGASSNGAFTPSNGAPTLGNGAPTLGNGAPTLGNGASSGNANGTSSGVASGDSSLSRDALASFGLPVDPQKAFDNPSTEKEYLNYIASVKLYLANQQQNNRNPTNPLGNNNFEEGNSRSLPFSPLNNDYSNSSSSLLSPSNSIWSRRPYEMIDDLGTTGHDGAGNGGGDDVGGEGDSGPKSLFPSLPNGTVPTTSTIVDQVLASPNDQLTSILKSIELDSRLPTNQRSDAALVNNNLPPSLNGFRDSSSILEKTKTWPPPRTPWGLVNFNSAPSEASDAVAAKGETRLLQEKNIWGGSKALF